MRFGPEIDDALGGRLKGDVYFLPNHCAAILRALLLRRTETHLCICMPYTKYSESAYELKFHTSTVETLSGNLDAYLQEGFVEQKDLSRVLSSKTVHVHLLCREPKACVALLQKTNSNTFQKRIFQTVAFLPRLLPGIFTEHPLLKTETALLEAAFESDIEKIEVLLEQIYDESEIKDQRQKKAIQDFVTYQLNEQLGKARTAVTTAERNANDHLRHYMQYSEIATNSKYLVDSLAQRIDSMAGDVDEVLKFLSKCKTASVTVDNGQLVLDVTAPLSNFDPDAYRIIRDNNYSFLWRSIVGDTADARLFFDALFLDEIIKVNVSACYLIEPCHGVSCSRISKKSVAIPNPHIQYYSCLGQYNGAMQTALAKSDFVGLINLCIASTQSLNVPDSPPCESFIKDVTGGSHKAVLLPGGEAVSYEQAVAWLKQNRIGAETSGETNQTNE